MADELDKTYDENLMLRKQNREANQLLLKIANELEKEMKIQEEKENDVNDVCKEYFEALLKFKSELEEIRVEHDINSQIVLQLLDENAFLLNESSILKEYVDTFKSLQTLRSG